MLRISNPETFRANLQQKTKSWLIDHNMTDPDKWAENIEIGVYNFAVRESTSRKVLKKWDNPLFVQLYTDRYRTLYNNLAHILPTMMKGEITADQLSHMTHQELVPEHWKEMLEQKMKRDMAKRNTVIESMTDVFTCRKCGSKRTTYYQQQVRSADEPMTIFVSCIDCSHRWRN